MTTDPATQVGSIPQTTAVRPGHEFDEQALAHYLSAVIGASGALTVRQFEGGQSNPTFLLHYAGRDYVMRKQPPGRLLPSAHQVGREYRVMKALTNTGVPVPRMYALNEDPKIIGTHFFLMEHVVGRVFSDPLLPELAPSERRALYQHLVDVLAALHQVNYLDVGLADFGRPGNYYARQIGRWTKQYLASQTDELPQMERLMAWLPENVPDAGDTVIVHGDFRLGNMIVHPTEPRIVAVLDWELSTLGDALADLGYICMDYHTATDIGGEQGLDRPDLADLGIPGEDEQVDRYCARTGRKRIDNWNFYLIYNLFRSGAIIQGVYKRGLDGNASSQLALTYADACAKRADLACALLDTDP